MSCSYTSLTSLSVALRNALDGFFVLDRERRFVLFNQGCERITGYTSEEVVGRQCQCSDMMLCHDRHGRHLWGALCPARAVFEGGSEGARQRMEIRRKDGSSVWIETIYTPVRDRGGQVECVLGVVRDISEAMEREGELRSEIDTLRTGATTTASPECCPASESLTLRLDDALAQVEREVIVNALRAADWHRNRAAELMNISRSRLYRRMEALGIKPGELA